MGFRRKTKPGKSLMAFAWYTGGSMSVPVTKFSLRMYGSRKGVEQEQERQEKVGAFVIHPYSNFRFYWDFVSLVLLIISMIIIPVAITFFNDKMTSDPGWMAFNLVLDFWFLSDIIINFHTGIIVEYGDGDVVLNLRRIRTNYLKTWFFVDLLSTLPIDYILQLLNGVSASASASRAMKLFRFAKMLSLLRLLRISRLIRYVHQWEEIVNMQYDLAVAAVRIFNLVCLMLLIGHWNGCLQYMVPMLYDFPPDSWIVVDKLQDASWGEKYSWALFKAMSHMLCIGYGQQPPKNLMDLWMTMISMVSGAVCFAMFIGHTTALIQSLDSSKRQYKEKYMQVKEYMRYRRLPKSIRMKVYEYYENRFQGKMFDEQGILAEISPSLQEEIVNFNCRHLVASVPFFRNAEQEFVTEVVQKLKFEVFQPTDIIVKEGSMGKKMYFIQHGVVEIKSVSNLNTTQLSDGSYFGEICLLTNQRRVASVFAVTNCCIYSLHADDFNELLPRFPIMKRTLETVAASRLSKLGRFSSVLDRRARQQKNIDPTSTEIAEEIRKHDEKSAEKTPRHQSAHGNRIQNFRRNNINSPNKKYQAYFRPQGVDSELTPLHQYSNRSTEQPILKETSDQIDDAGGDVRKHPHKRSRGFIKKIFQQNRECEGRKSYLRYPSNTNGYLPRGSMLETNFMKNNFAENDLESPTSMQDFAKMLCQEQWSKARHSETIRSSPDGENSPNVTCTGTKHAVEMTCEATLEEDGSSTIDIETDVHQNQAPLETILENTDQTLLIASTNEDPEDNRESFKNSPSVLNKNPSIEKHFITDSKSFSPMSSFLTHTQSLPNLEGFFKTFNSQPSNCQNSKPLSEKHEWKSEENNYTQRDYPPDH
ncbi:potassium/sodium hyperpolarization-activated cyclic nucleotide-gated channel 3-like isoform X1 [Styela clava]